MWFWSDDARQHARALLQLDDDRRIGRPGREPGMVRLVHHHDAEDAAATAHPLPLGTPRQTAAAHLARREAKRAALEAALRHQLVAPRRLPERRHLRRDRRNRPRRSGAALGLLLSLLHEGSLDSTSVECVDRMPPLPDTSATSCCGT